MHCAKTIPTTPQKDPIRMEVARIIVVMAFHFINALACPVATIMIDVNVVIGVTMVEIAKILNIRMAPSHPDPRRIYTNQSEVTNIKTVTNMVAIAILVISDSATLRSRSGSSFTRANADCIRFITGGRI